jgi:hypothetical protein
MASTYLRKAFSTTGDRQKFSLSMWIKRGSGLGVEQMLCECYSGSSAKDEIWLQSNDTLNFVKTDGGGLATTTAPVYRDVGAWYHFLIAADSTQGSNADRIKIYKNGVQQTLGQQDTIPVNSNFQFGASGAELTFGVKNDLSWYFNGSMANVEMVDGQQLTPAYFGSTDSNTGIWKPGGSSTISDYGTNGFKLKMDTTSPGADTSGKSNTFTPSGTPTLLQGSPSNNWCTWNSLVPLTTNYVYSNGNNTVNQTSGAWVKTVSTIGVNSGKWYWEVSATNAQISAGKYTVIGVATTTDATAASGMSPNGIGMKNNGSVGISTVLVATLSGFELGDIISCYLDMDNGALYYAKDGVMENSGVPTSGASKTGAFSLPNPTETHFAYMSPYGTNNKAEANFGEGFFGTTAAGTQADDNGQGLFAYDVPAGYYALNTKNLEAYG